MEEILTIYLRYLLETVAMFMTLQFHKYNFIWNENAADMSRQNDNNRIFVGFISFCGRKQALNKRVYNTMDLKKA